MIFYGLKGGPLRPDKDVRRLRRRARSRLQVRAIYTNRSPHFSRNYRSESCCTKPDMLSGKERGLFIIIRFAAARHAQVARALSSPHLGCRFLLFIVLLRLQDCHRRLLCAPVSPRQQARCREHPGTTATPNALYGCR